MAHQPTPNRSDSRAQGDFPQPVRKQVTVLFCDVADYTSRSVALDPEDLADEIRVFQTLCAEVAEKYHGHISNYLGDGILVLFGHPLASEFDPEHAVRAGMEMVERIKRNNASEKWRGREAMAIRIGIATGLVVVGERAGNRRDQDELIFGEAPNLAARLQSLAEPNSVLTALRTRRLVGSAFKFRDLGEHRVKGFTEPLGVWQILHQSTFQNRSTTSLKRVTTRFVSRHRELRCLRENYAHALDGRGRIIHLCGDPGIGKSRLLRAFEKTIHKPELYRLRVTCSPYFQGSPFKPIVDETHRWLQIGESDDVETRREHIRRAMIAIELDGKDEHALFNELLGIPPASAQTPIGMMGDISAEEKHHRTVKALVSFVIQLSRLRPLWLVVEDLHWADPSTLEVLSGIVSAAGAEKLCAVFTSRTNFVMPWPEAATLVEMKLGGLDASASARLIAAMSGGNALPALVTQRIIGKSGGVPLFLEETTRHLLDQMRAQSRTEEVAANQIREPISVGEHYGSFTIPDTLQDSLNARLDRLGQAKSFAQLAATFGGHFRYSLISKVAAQNQIDADAGMDALQAADLISVISETAEDRYEFRHALFQDAAYHSLLKKTRQRYHLQIAERLQQDNPDIGQQHPELIAHHYSHTERVDRAVDLWLRAGEQAIAQSATNESVQHLSQGLRLAADLPDGQPRRVRELALLLNLGVALTARSGYHGAQVTHTYKRASALAEVDGDDRQTWTALYGQWRCLVSQAEFYESMRVSFQLKSLSEKSRDPELLMTAFGLQGMTRMVTGKFASAEYFYDKAVRLYDQSSNKNPGVRFGQDPYVTIRGLGAVNKLLLNKIPQSVAEIDKSVAAARAIGHFYTVAETLRVAAMYQQIAGNFKQLGELAEETVEIAQTYGFEGLLAAGNLFRAFCRVMRRDDSSEPGEPIEARDKSREVRRMESNLRRYEDNYGKLFLPYFHGLLAQARLAVVDYRGAMQAAQGALAMVERFGEKWWLPCLLEIKAQAAAQGGLAEPAEIDQWHRTAMETAEIQQADFIVCRLRAND